MKIIILGAGQVGATLAEHLANEANDITVVDLNQERLQDIQDRCDLRTVVGHAAHPSTLRQAGTQAADMLVAVTSSDESNMLACQIAYTLFQTPTKIARVRGHQFLELKTIFSDETIPVDVVISPEQMVTESISRLLAYPGTLQVLDFADHTVMLAAIQAQHGGSMIGHPIHAFRTQLPSVETRVAAIYRNDEAIIPDQNVVITPDDEVFVLAQHAQLQALVPLLRTIESPYRRIMIAGGGHIGMGLAQQLESMHRVKLIEKTKNRAQQIADKLEHTTVLQGDCADKLLLLNENIEDTDVFCALTNDDEANIMAAILAKKLGARKTMALINRSSYVELIEDSAIDIVISPHQITLSAFLRHVRKGDIVQVHTLRRGAAEAIEMVAHGTRDSSKVVGRSIRQLSLPNGVTIGALVRNHKIIMANQDIEICSDDRVIMFLPNKAHIPTVERLFQVGLNFF